MKKLTIPILIASLVVMVLISEVRAEIVTTDEALTVANNWINAIIQKKGSWGDANSAFVEDIKEFKRGKRRIGYFCKVRPVGYILVSLRKELAPVKAYSARTELEPDVDEGLADYLKGRMERILDKIEERFGSVKDARPADVRSLLEVDYSPAWEQLEAGVPPMEKAAAAAASDYVEPGNYQEGDFLLETSWWQGHPYNLYCPVPPPGSDCTWDHCTVGCNATAGAQMLRHWCWPPYGEGGYPYSDIYEWWNMPNTIDGSSPSAQIHATAELNYEVGIAGGQSYCVNNGCATAGHITNMRPGYINHFRYYAGSSVPERSNYTLTGWFNLIKAQLNVNRPMTYGIPGHAIVCDGWQEVTIPPSPFLVKQYHMNWGWADAVRDIWYTLDSFADPPMEHLLADNFPETAIGSTIVAGTYPKNAFPYRYLDQDTYAGFSTTFASGNILQFLHGIRMKANGYIRVESTPSVNTRLFSRGDQGHGIRLMGGTMALYSGGSLKLY